MQPPIPSVEATCPQCGHVIENPRMKYCANCGAALTPSASALSGLKIFGAICLAMLALPLAGAGACFVVIFGLDSRGSEIGLIGIGLGLLLAAATCVWGIVKLVKR